jgi:sugar O-acyltransferase (sialic acid O-acetyltransferase NeuD family)
VPLWILGGGGHAKTVIEVVRRGGCHEISGILDGNPLLRDQAVLGIPVLDELTKEAVARHQIRHAVIAIGDNRTRERIALNLSELVLWPCVIDPQAVMISDFKPGEGTIVVATSVVQPDARIGCHVILCTGCTVAHDCVVGDFAHIGPGCDLEGEVEIGEGALLGIGSTVNRGRRIGKWSIIGACAVVVDDIPDNSVAIGVPARVVRPVVPEVKMGKSRRLSTPQLARSRRL